MKFKLKLDEETFRVEQAQVTGSEILALVGKTHETHLLSQVLKDEDDILIQAGEVVDLSEPGKERFTVILKEDELHSCTLTIEGNEYEWTGATITAEQIAELGGWDPAVGVVLLYPDGHERTLSPGEVVNLGEDNCFCRNVTWKRGSHELANR